MAICVASQVLSKAQLKESVNCTARSLDSRHTCVAVGRAAVVAALQLAVAGLVAGRAVTRTALVPARVSPAGLHTATALVAPAHMHLHQQLLLLSPRQPGVALQH